MVERGKVRKSSDFGVGTAARVATRWQDDNIYRRLILKCTQKLSMDFQDTLRIPSWLKTVPRDHPAMASSRISFTRWKIPNRTSVLEQSASIGHYTCLNNAIPSWSQTVPKTCIWPFHARTWFRSSCCLTNRSSLHPTSPRYSHVFTR